MHHTHDRTPRGNRPTQNKAEKRTATTPTQTPKQTCFGKTQNTNGAPTHTQNTARTTVNTTHIKPRTGQRTPPTFSTKKPNQHASTRPSPTKPRDTEKTHTTTRTTATAQYKCNVYDRTRQQPKIRTRPDPNKKPRLTAASVTKGRYYTRPECPETRRRRRSAVSPSPCSQSAQQSPRKHPL